MDIDYLSFWNLSRLNLIILGRRVAGNSCGHDFSEGCIRVIGIGTGGGVGGNPVEGGLDAFNGGVVVDFGMMFSVKCW